ncbi:MAG: hypothetical protein U1F48_13865 [Burkholderiales bacterium]
MRSTTTWRRHFLTAAGGLALCVAFAASGQVVTCPGNSCDVVVTVSGNPLAPAVNAPVLRMKQGSRNPVITWKLQATDNYEFRADSIRPHTGPPTAQKQTTTQAQWDDQCTRLNTSRTTIRIRNKNTTKVTLDYDVTVYDKQTGKGYTLDPRIVNDP